MTPSSTGSTPSASAGRESVTRLSHSLYLPEGAVELPPCPARVVDTTGTGDSFAGGLLAGLLCHGDLVRAAREASACGALTAEALGAHRAFGWEEVRARAAQAAATCAAADSPPAGR